MSQRLSRTAGVPRRYLDNVVDEEEDNSESLCNDIDESDDEFRQRDGDDVADEITDEDADADNADDADDNDNDNDDDDDVDDKPRQPKTSASSTQADRARAAYVPPTQKRKTGSRKVTID
jgi:hypothetical protein